MGTDEQAQALIVKAVQAPSSHNTQPWRFRVDGATIDLSADRSRALPVNDPDDRELTSSCGAALMNLRVAAAGQGLGIAVERLPDATQPDWLARVSIRSDSRPPPSPAPQGSADLPPYPLPGPPPNSPPNSPLGRLAVLNAFIEQRRTHRKGFSERVVDPAIVEQLVAAAEFEGALLHPLTTAAVREQAAALVAEGDAVQWSMPAWRQELAAWMRPRRSGEGLTVPAMLAPVIGFMIARFDLGKRIAVQDQALAAAAPVLAVLATEHDRPNDWLRAGEALQRLLLVACRQGLQAGYLNQPIQVAALRPRLQGLIGGGFPQLLLRLGYLPEGSRFSSLPPTPRRPSKAVLDPINQSYSQR
ncbi:MAG: nitroreductase [Gammaproteobacteria bacterium]|jgi:nitroreductase|nr:nitroreductase [Gammaproteobacteria bacterium]